MPALTPSAAQNYTSLQGNCNGVNFSEMRPSHQLLVHTFSVFTCRFGNGSGRGKSIRSTPPPHPSPGAIPHQRTGSPTTGVHLPPTSPLDPQPARSPGLVPLASHCLSAASNLLAWWKPLLTKQCQQRLRHARERAAIRATEALSAQRLLEEEESERGRTGEKKREGSRVSGPLSPGNPEPSVASIKC